jgi:hypothetical protein
MQPGRMAALAALLVGGLFAAVSVYWGLGGTWLLDTVGGELEESARAHAAATQVAVWGSAALKLVASVLPMTQVRPLGRPRLDRSFRALTWVEAVVLIGYGGVLTGAGPLVQAGILDAFADADPRALAWHAYLWDPWFLVWGLLVLLVLWSTRAGLNSARRSQGPVTGRPRRGLEVRAVTRSRR